MEARTIDSVPTGAFGPTGVRAGPMLVAVEASRMVREVRGIRRYVRALLPRLITLRPGLRLAVFVKNQRDARALAPWLDTIPSLRDRVELRALRGMARAEADVFWYPWNVASPVPASSPVVVTIHDIAPIAHPDPRLRGVLKNLRWRHWYSATARRATLIIADSQFTANEVHRMLDFPHERMRVVPLAADDFAAPPESGDDAALERLGVRRPFVLAVGAADRRKNLGLLERAMPAVRAAHPDASLVLAGPRRRSSRGQSAESWRHTLGFVTDDELAALYRQAAVFVMPSTYEGFGLPVLEAMRMGAPVVCVDASSLPEVAATAAAWVSADDDRLLARTISSVMSDASVAARMRAASIAQASRFSWDETARQTLAAFEAAMALARR